MNFALASASPADSIAFQQAKRAYEAHEYHKAWSQLQELSQKEDLYPETAVEVQSLLGRLTYRLNLEPDSTRHYLQQTLNLCKAFGFQEKEIYFRSIRDQARYFYMNKMYDSALYYMHSALPHLSEKVALQERTFFYEYMFVLYYTQDKFWTARDYLLKAEEYMYQEDNMKKKHIIRHLHNKIYMYQSIKAFDEARKVYQELLNISPDLPHYKKGGYNLSVLNKSIADIYLTSQVYDSAIIYAQKALTHFRLSKQADPAYHCFINLTIATALEEQNKWEDARSLLLENLQRTADLSQLNTSSIKSETYRGLARLSTAQGDFKTGLAYLNEAEKMYSDNYLLLPSFPQSKKNEDKVQLMHIKWEKAKLLRAYYEIGQQAEHLQHANEQYMQAVRLMALVRQESFSDQDKIQHIEEYYELYEEALACLYDEYEVTNSIDLLHRVFEVMENSQSALLSDHRKLESAKPVELAQKEDSLLTTRSKLLQEVELQEDDSLLRQKLSDVNIQLRQLNWQFTNRFITTDMKTGELIEEIQDRLSEKSAVFLSYFNSSDALYIFLLDEEGEKLKKIPLDPLFQISLEAFKNDLYGQAYDSKLRFEGRVHAYTLYQKLVEPIKTHLDDKELLIISRTGQMNYIPFDALISENSPKAPYLLEKYRIHYVFSAHDWQSSLHRHSPAPTSHKKYTVLAMAPFSPADNINEPTRDNTRKYRELLLPASLKEVNSISKKPKSGNMATKGLFVQESQHYEIIHLATHAKADAKNPLNSHILFYPDDSLRGFKLYSHEIMNLDLKSTQLVVLSACQTGDGKLQKGEGLMSLSRSFAYAGVSNIIMSLWNADDEATAFILERFYHHLRAGKGKAYALREAKLDFLRNPAFDPYSQNPVYWANLQLIGNDNSMYQNTENNTWVIIMGCLVLSILVYLQFIRRKNYSA